MVSHKFIIVKIIEFDFFIVSIIDSSLFTVTYFFKRSYYNNAITKNFWLWSYTRFSYT
jgi:hypothetical protein